MKPWFGGTAMAVALALVPYARADDLQQPTIGAAARYYQDSDHNHRYDQSLDAVIPLARRALTIEADSHWATDPTGNAASQEVLLGAKDQHSPPYSLIGGLGLVRFVAGVSAAGFVEARRDSEPLHLRLRVEYTPIVDTAEIIRNEIMFAGVELYSKASLTERVHPAVLLFAREYSDNNDSVRLRGDIPYALLLAPVRWDIGYRQEYLAFRRQTHHGYFNPDELHSFQAVSSVSYWTQEWEVDAEAFGGVQKSRTSGSSSVDSFGGFYAEAALRPIAGFQFAFTAEADDYAPTSASGFRHLQVGVRLTRTL